MIISIHWQLSRGLSASHIVTQSQETHYCCQAWRKIISQGILLVWFSSINSDLRSCSKKHAKKRLFFQTLVTILTTAFTHLFWWRDLSSAIRSPSQEKREENQNKNKEMMKSKKTTGKAQKGSKEDTERKEMRDEERRKEERDGLIQRMSRGRDQWQLSAHGPDWLNCVATRSSGQESFQSRTRSSTRANLEAFFFLIFFWWILLKEIQKKN